MHNGHMADGIAAAHDRRLAPSAFGVSKAYGLYGICLCEVQFKWSVFECVRVSGVVLHEPYCVLVPESSSPFCASLGGWGWAYVRALARVALRARGRGVERGQPGAHLSRVVWCTRRWGRSS